MTTPSAFHEALARLDTEIADTEAKLDDLRLKRTGAEAFLAYMTPVAATVARQHVEKTPSTAAGGPADVVWRTIPINMQFGVDDVLHYVADAGVNLTREQVRNAIHYLVRKGALTKVGRGTWRRDTEAPAVTGASDQSDTTLGGESGETTETETNPRDVLDQPLMGPALVRTAM